MENLAGKKYGRWTFIRKLKKQYWLVQCDCGTIGNRLYPHIKSGHSKSCGCYRRETLSRRAIHGMAQTPTWNTWVRLRQKCFNKNETRHYKNYGGRGITVCERWGKFENFLTDMGVRPPGLSIDRIDNNGNYEPSNCRWASIKEQANNKRTSVYWNYRGETLTMAQWGEKIGISNKNLWARVVKRKWPIEKALSTPLRFCSKPGTRSCTATPGLKRSPQNPVSR